MVLFDRNIITFGSHWFDVYPVEFIKEFVRFPIDFVVFIEVALVRFIFAGGTLVCANVVLATAKTSTIAISINDNTYVFSIVGRSMSILLKV